jgi:hypothetical protein
LRAVIAGLALLCGCSASQTDTRADRAPDMRSADAQGVDARSTDAEPNDARATDARAIDARLADARTHEPDAQANGDGADVTAVSVGGAPGGYTFSVTLSSPDTGCEQYANWWEVLDANGALLYRRILGHSHVDEQPFTRSGGPVAVEANDVVWVRAHMHPNGYGGQLMRGTPGGAFEVVSQPAGWPDVAAEPPQPGGCAF